MTQGSINRTSGAGAQQAVKQVVTQKVDSAAMRLVQEAESQAAAIRQQAESLASRIKLAGYEQADALTSKAGDDPLAAAVPSSPPTSCGRSRTPRLKASWTRPAGGPIV